MSKDDVKQNKKDKEFTLLRFLGLETGLAIAAAGVILIVLAWKGYF